MRKLWLMIALTLGAVGGVGIVSAQQPRCDQRDSQVSYLQRTYAERPVAVGVTADGSLIEVLATDSGSSWSILATSARGLSCLVVAGEAWKMITASFGTES